MQYSTVQYSTNQLVSVWHGGQHVAVYLRLVHTTPPWVLPLIQLGAFKVVKKGRREKRDVRLNVRGKISNKRNEDNIRGGEQSIAVNCGRMVHMKDIVQRARFNR